MKQRKRILSLLLTVVMTVGLSTVSAAAAGSTPNRELNAQVLSAMGLFKGYDDSGANFGLNDRATREHALVFLIRMLGEEKAALAWTGTQPYTDVPANNWAIPYIGYAKENGLTVGIGNNKFGLGVYARMDEMTTFALRGLGYSDQTAPKDFTISESLRFAKSLGILDSDSKPEVFTRGDAVDIIDGAVAAKVKGQSYTLLEELVNNGAVTQAQVEKANAIGDGKPAQPTATANDLASGTYKMGLMGKYIRVASGKLEIHSTAPAQGFTVTNKGEYSHIQADDGKYVTIASTDDGTQLTTGSTAYSWVIQKQSGGDYSIRPYAKATLVVNASGEKSVNGTKVIVWANSDAPKSTQITMTAADKNVAVVTGVKLDQTTTSVAVGKTTKLTGTIAPATAANQGVTWSSNAPAIAKVDANGVVTGLKPGTATITVKTEDGGKTATCKITVTAAATDKAVTAKFTMYNGTTKSITELYITDSSLSTYDKEFLSSNSYSSWSYKKTITTNFEFYPTTNFDILIRFSDGTEAEATGLSFAKATSAGGKINLGIQEAKLIVKDVTIASVPFVTKSATTDTSADSKKVTNRFNAAVKRYNGLVDQVNALGMANDAAFVKDMNTITTEIDKMNKVIGEGTGVLTAAQIKEYTTALDTLDAFMNQLEAAIKAPATPDAAATSKALNDRYSKSVNRFNTVAIALEKGKLLTGAVKTDWEKFASALNTSLNFISTGTSSYTKEQITTANAILDEVDTLLNEMDKLIAAAKAEPEKPTSITAPLMLVNSTDVKIAAVHMTPQKTNHWGSSLGKLAIGESASASVTFSSDALVWDLQITDELGATIEFRNIDFTNCSASGGTITLTLDANGGVATPSW